MPSDIANKIVKQIFGDEKAAAIDSMNDALSAATYDAIQQQKINFEAVPQKVPSGNFNLASSNFFVLPSSCQ